MSRALTERGHGRVVTWLALEGYDLGTGSVHFRDVAAAAHALGKKQRRGKGVPPLVDVQYTVVLATLTLLAESVLGRAILADAGLGEGDAARDGFGRWLARLLVDHLEVPVRKDG